MISEYKKRARYHSLQTSLSMLNVLDSTKAQHLWNNVLLTDETKVNQNGQSTSE